jgi:hypothetical protein
VATYLLCGALFLVWVMTILRSRLSQTSAWIAFGSIVPLTMLVTYHRSYDAKLLLLAIPAFAMVWAERGMTGWLAAIVTTAALVSTADIPLTLLLIINQYLDMSTAGLFRRILSAVLQRPTPLILVAMVSFYLWVYLRRTVSERGTAFREAQEEQSATFAFGERHGNSNQCREP